MTTEIVIPNLISKYSQMELPDPNDYEYYMSKTNRCFYVDYEIYRDADTDFSEMTQLCKTIINMNVEEMVIPKELLKPIYIFIDSPGGDLDIAFSLVDVIKSSRIPVYTIGLGNVMSAAFILFLSGHKKYLFPHCQLLCHQGQAYGISGSPSEVEEATKNLKKTYDKMKKYILDNTEIDAKTYSKNQKKDWYISPQEAVNDFGIADAIINNIGDIFICNTETTS